MSLVESDNPPAASHDAGWIQWLALAPLLVWLGAFVVVPTGIMLVYSFCQRDELGQVVYDFTLENYVRVFEGLTWATPLRALAAGIVGAIIIASLAALWMHRSGRQLTIAALARPARRGLLVAAVVAMHLEILSPHFQGVYLRILWRSAAYAALTTLLCLIIGYPVAYVMGTARRRWRSILLAAVMIPFWTSFLVRTYAWITILKEQGLLNATLTAMRLTDEPISILYTPLAVVIGLVYAYLPFMILPIYASLERLDPGLIDAALDLGARPLRVFSSVIVPLTFPGIAAGVLLVFVPAVGMFAVTDLMGGAKVLLIGNVIQNQFGQARDWPFGAALGIVLLAMFAVVFAAAAGELVPRDRGRGFWRRRWAGRRGGTPPGQKDGASHLHVAFG
ncbi:ABC transporter permease [Fontivita pretiosa]|uniref:ABC transporter permease n=1 Tax=Fontivita pretiosa TaxID=2989684 RepID=UPI003D170BA8